MERGFVFIPRDLITWIDNWDFFNLFERVLKFLNNSQIL